MAKARIVKYRDGVEEYYKIQYPKFFSTYMLFLESCKNYESIEEAESDIREENDGIVVEVCKNYMII